MDQETCRPPPYPGRHLAVRQTGECGHVVRKRFDAGIAALPVCLGPERVVGSQEVERLIGRSQVFIGPSELHSLRVAPEGVVSRPSPVRRGPARLVEDEGAAVGSLPAGVAGVGVWKDGEQDSPSLLQRAHDLALHPERPVKKLSFAVSRDQCTTALGGRMSGVAPVILTWIDSVNRAYPWSHNDHYHRWVVRQVPRRAVRALDVGCGTGNLVGVLSRVVGAVDGIDCDAGVIDVARRAQGALSTARFGVRDLLELPAEPTYDVVTALAVVHHLPLGAALERMRSVLRPGGRLIVVGCYRPDGWRDDLVDVVAVPANMVMGLVKRRQADRARIAMSAPVAPPETTLREVKSTAVKVLPGARVRRRLFWRYSLVYSLPGGPGPA